ncbi:MAG: hypothetical protein AAFQ15_16105 [Pseudomonadota bacterium]
MIRTILYAASAGLVLTACNPAGQDPFPEAPTPDIADAPADDVAADAAADPEPGTDAAPSPEDIPSIGYPDGWEMQLYWSGEYPNAFSVTEEGVTVMGRETISYGGDPSITCTLPHKATYSPWNRDRNDSDRVEYVSMVFPTTFTLKEDVTLAVLVGDGEEELSLSAEDQMIYKSYLAEGWFIAEKDGVQYEMNESDLPQSTVYEQGPEDQEWVRVTCGDAEKTRAWVLYEDAIAARGVEPYEYTGFAEAADLP